MSLDKLVGKSLERIKSDADNIGRLLTAAQRNIADAHVEEVSHESRFDAAYKAIMQLANAALQASGYRTLTSKPGHHITMLESLGETLGVDKKTLIILNTLRKQRNLADYSGERIPASAMNECITQAERLHEMAKRRLHR